MADDHSLSVYVENTKLWLRDAVIGWGLCPFASRPFLEDRVRIREVLTSTELDLLEAILHEAALVA